MLPRYAVARHLGAVRCVAAAALHVHHARGLVVAAEASGGFPFRREVRLDFWIYMYYDFNDVLMILYEVGYLRLGCARPEKHVQVKDIPSGVGTCIFSARVLGWVVIAPVQLLPLWCGVTTI